MNELLQQVRLLDPVSQTDRVTDVLIVDGAIAAVEAQITEYPTNTQLRDCRGLVLGPGLVDLYSYSGEPGFEERETLFSLASAASVGGFTRIGILPTTLPPLDRPTGLARLQSLWSFTHIQAYYWAALTLELQGQQMTELVELATSGVVGFTDGQPLENLVLVRRLLEYLKPLDKPVALWACDRQLQENGVMREGIESIRFGLPSVAEITETSALAALLEIVAVTGTPVHIMRVSTARGVELIQAAKARGLPITASTSWMHLLLDTQAISSYNPNLRVDPPLGNLADMVALRQGIKQGIIDAIAIDHTPYTYEEKTVAFAAAPPGAIGLELALPLLWQHLVETSEWSALELWRVLSTHPAECLHQVPAVIAPGKPAEMTLFDPQLSWIVERETLKSRSLNTPWLGQNLTGRVVQTWFNPNSGRA